MSERAGPWWTRLSPTKSDSISRLPVCSFLYRAILSFCSGACSFFDIKLYDLFFFTFFSPSSLQTGNEIVDDFFDNLRPQKGVRPAITHWTIEYLVITLGSCIPGRTIRLNSIHSCVSSHWKIHIYQMSRALFFLSWETIVLIESKPTVDVIEFNVMLAMSCMERMGHNGGDVFIFYWRDDNNKSRRESIPLGQERTRTRRGVHRKRFFA